MIRNLNAPWSWRISKYTYVKSPGLLAAPFANLVRPLSRLRLSRVRNLDPKPLVQRSKETQTAIWII